MYKIAKEFDFCYGHRVWSQELNCDFSLDSCLKCRHLHGHQGKLIIYLEAEKLEKGMVTDFKHLNWVKKFIDDVLDHKFIMDLNDPIIDHEVPIMRALRDADSLEKYPEGYYLIPNPTSWDLNPAVGEKYEGLVFVDFVPTSENLSKWIFDIVQEKMRKINIAVSRVQFYETPKSQSNYFNH